MPDFQQTADALNRAEEDPALLANALAQYLPVSGASVSTLGALLGTQTIAASDRTIAELDEAQFDLGEGPCWDALATLSPVQEPDLHEHPNARWPAYSRAAGDRGVRAVFAFPLTVGPLRIGAIDLYSLTPTALDPTTTKEATELASIVGRQVLRDALRTSAADDWASAGPYSRRAVHQATGFVIAQCGVSAEDAHLLIQGHAFAEGVSMDAIAQEVIAGRLVFTPTGTTRRTTDGGAP